MKRLLSRLFYKIAVKQKNVYETAEFRLAVKNGMKVGKNFNRLGGCIFDPSHCFLIQIGDNVTLAPSVHILAHDASTKRELDYTKIGKVVIGNNVFIGANTTVLPGVTIGDNTVIGAGSVVASDIPENTVAAGNPAKIIMSYDAYMDKNRNKMTADITFDDTYKISVIDSTKKQEIKDKLDRNRIGYIK